MSLTNNKYNSNTAQTYHDQNNGVEIVDECRSMTNDRESEKKTPIKTLIYVDSSVIKINKNEEEDSDDEAKAIEKREEELKVSKMTSEQYRNYLQQKNDTSLIGTVFKFGSGKQYCSSVPYFFLTFSFIYCDTTA